MRQREKNLKRGPFSVLEVGQRGRVKIKTESYAMKTKEGDGFKKAIVLNATEPYKCLRRERISGLANYTRSQKTLLLESVLCICQLEGHWQLLLNNFRGVMRLG